MLFRSAARPNTPIVLVEDRRFTNDWITPNKKKFHEENHAALKAAYEQLNKEGVTKLSYIPGDALYGTDTEGATEVADKPKRTRTKKKEEGE